MSRDSLRSQALKLLFDPAVCAVRAGCSALADALVRRLDETCWRACEESVAVGRGLKGATTGSKGCVTGRGSPVPALEEQQQRAQRLAKAACEAKSVANKRLVTKLSCEDYAQALAQVADDRTVDSRDRKRARTASQLAVSSASTSLT